MSNKISFTQKRVDIGVIEPGSKTLVEFEYSGDRNDIISVSPDCGCTASVEITDRKILCTFTENGGDSRAKIPNLKQTFPSGYETVLKGLSVFVNDGKETHILKDEGLVENPEKEKLRIEFTGRVKVW